MRKSITIICVCVALTALMFTSSACKADTSDGAPTECAHVWHDIASEYNRVATYEESGRQMRKCALCGKTVGFVIPKVEYTDGKTAPEYKELLDEPYEAQYGDTLNDVAKKYFSEGWSFDLDPSTEVGVPSAEPYTFFVTFRAKGEGYSEVKRSIQINVKKRKIRMDDIAIETVQRISATDQTLADVAISVKSTSAVKGTIEWATGQNIMRGQSADYIFIFTPSDADLYEKLEGVITLRAEPKD